MPDVTLSPIQQENLQKLLLKENKTQKEREHLRALDAQGLLPDRIEGNALAGFFEDKPAAEFGVRTGTALAPELGTAALADKYIRGRGIPQKVEGKTRHALFGQPDPNKPTTPVQQAIRTIGTKGKKVTKFIPGAVGKIAQGAITLGTLGAEALAAYLGDKAGQTAVGQDIDEGEARLAGGLSAGGSAAFRLGKTGVNIFRGKRALRDVENPHALRGFQRRSVEAEQAGIVFPLSNLIKNTSIEIGTSIAKQAPLSAGAARRSAESFVDFYNRLINNYANQFARHSNTGAVSSAIKTVIEDANSFARGYQQVIMGELDSVAKGKALVNLKEIGGGTRTFTEAVEMLENATPATRGKIITQMKLATDDLVNEADEVLNQLMKDHADNPELLEVLGGVTGRAGGSISKEEAIASVEAAIMFSTKNADSLKHGLVEALAASQPQVFVDDLLFSTQGNPEIITAAMRILSSKQPGLVSNVRSVFLGGTKEGTGLLGASSTVVGGMRMLDPDLLISNIQQFRNVNKGAEFALMGSNGLEGLEELAQEMAALTIEKGSKAGTMSVFLSTPAAAATIGSIPFGVPAGVAISGAGTILFGPRAIQAGLNNPKWVKRMVEGVTKYGENALPKVKFYQKLVSQMIAAGLNVSWIPDERKKVKFEGGGSL